MSVFHKILNYFLKCSVVALIVGGLFVVKEKIQQARYSEMQANLKSLTYSLEAYRNIYSKYTNDREQLGFKPEGKLRSVFYLSADELPSQLRQQVAEEDFPFVSDDQYQLLISFEQDDGDILFWKTRNGEDLTRVNILVKGSR
ncbi:hypothetical protein AZI87_00855 [Bdellovibrio bacteriovorus]|uniref:Uncharacterized protein n=1 Tax=Bdellovibrio bacteriovorus TaxID=959 RepID=A0A162GD87_BDEBC|nr:hypothetical protein [Bdellovibrio bacteriovorus]KYG67860.1 hypothetical protein AZI87_00855 [Bdellovibrio bacteriovorus]